VSVPVSPDLVVRFYDASRHGRCGRQTAAYLVPRRLAEWNVASEGSGGNLDPEGGGLVGEGAGEFHGSAREQCVTRHCCRRQLVFSIRRGFFGT
jgi:hypothetical protein